MGTDWTSYLQSLQQSTQPRESSLFPTSPWGNLASLIKAAAIPRATDLASKQQQMIMKLKEAQQFGLPGIRQLYDDPIFQKLAKEVGAPLPKLPPPSSEELLESRKQAFLSEAGKTQQEGAKGPVPGKGFTNIPGQDETALGRRDLTAQELKKMYTGLAQKYPEAAASTGIVPKVSPGTMSTLLRGILDYRMNPAQVLAGIDLMLSQSGQDPNALDPEIRQEITQLTVGPYAQAQMQNIQATTIQKINSADLSKARKDDLIKSFDERMALMEERINQAKSSGDYRTALTEIANINAEWLPKLNALKVRKEEAQITLLGAQTDFVRKHGEVFKSQESLNNARASYYSSNYGTGLGALKAQEQSLRTLISASLKHLQILQAATPTSDTERTTVEQLIKDETDNLKGYTSELANVRLAESQIPIAPVTPKGDGKPNPHTLNPVLPRIYNAVLNQVKDAREWQNAYNQLRNNKSLNALTPQDWNDLWYMFRQRAKQLGTDLPLDPSEVKK